jgi:predicted RNase H-like nuclease (RuvC/YqgF family)
VEIQCSLNEHEQIKNPDEFINEEIITKLKDENEQLKSEINVLKDEITNLNFQLSSISIQRSTTTDVRKINQQYFLTLDVSYLINSLLIDEYCELLFMRDGDQ